MQKLVTALFVVACTLNCSLAIAATELEIKKGAKIVEAYIGWMKKRKVRKGSIAVSYRGELVADGGIGRQSTDLAPIASLSKAITATCTMHALSKNGHSPSDPLEKVMPDFFSEFQVAEGAALRRVKVGQLITHTSGLRPDTVPKKLTGLRSYGKERLDWQLSKQKPYRTGKISFFYNNLNYLLLGKLISEISQSEYEQYCFNEILAPIGIKKARLYPKWRVLSSYGGWEISAQDYLKFANHVFAPDTVLGRNPFSLPNAHVGHGANYGVGSFFRKAQNGRNHWHFGNWDWRGSVHANWGAFFAVWANGYSVSINYEVHISDDERTKLDQLLYRAAH